VDGVSGGLTGVLADLDPNEAVPDALYLAALKHATTAPEVTFRDVLTFHRHCMHGGIDLALEVEGHPAPYIAAYRSMGLSAAADLLQAAASIASARFRWPWSNSRFARLNIRYVVSALPRGDQGPDVIEAAAVRYAQAHAPAFEAVVSAAKRGDHDATDFDRLFATPPREGDAP
jgi:hypothetical protein